jgi:hypothetical protein
MIEFVTRLGEALVFALFLVVIVLFFSTIVYAIHVNT